MAAETLHLTCSFLILQYLFQTSVASCTPSSCGVTPIISAPFRLKGDPSHCGDPSLELACENNVTSFSLNSHKYYVKELRYSVPDSQTNRVVDTMRLVDASLNNDTCSFPNSSAYHDQHYSFIPNYLRDAISCPINFMSCPRPLNNSLLFTETTHCNSNSSQPRFTYIRVGHTNASEVPETCRMDVIVLTSYSGICMDPSNLHTPYKRPSLEVIHSSLLYGFELFIDQSHALTKWGTFLAFLDTGLAYPFLILLLILVVLGPVVGPVMTLIGYTVVLGLLLLLASIANYFLPGTLACINQYNPLHAQSEYAYTLQVDEKSDIYSYGVVLLEILTRRRSVDAEYGEGNSIVDWVKSKMKTKNDIFEVLDKNGGASVREEMMLLLRVALLCTSRHPADRPSMRDVVSMLLEAQPKRKFLDVRAPSFGVPGAGDDPN